jgi:hypothetical protein
MFAIDQSLSLGSRFHDACAYLVFPFGRVMNLLATNADCKKKKKKKTPGPIFCQEKAANTNATATATATAHETID